MQAELVGHLKHPVLLVQLAGIGTGSSPLSTHLGGIQSFDEVKVRSTSSEAHTNVRFLSCDGHQLYERGVDLEVEGVRYIEMHRGPSAYVLGPPEPPRSREIPLIPTYSVL